MYICKSVWIFFLQLLKVQHWVATSIKYVIYPLKHNLNVSNKTHFCLASNQANSYLDPEVLFSLLINAKVRDLFLFHFQLHYFIKTEMFSWPGGLGVLGGCVCVCVCGGEFFHKWICQSPNSSHCWYYKIWWLKKTDNFLLFLLWIEEDTEIAGFQIECAN